MQRELADPRASMGIMGGLAGDLVAVFQAAEDLSEAVGGADGRTSK